MNINYTCEKLDAAVQTLKEGTSEVQYRLASAYLSQLRRLNADDFPKNLRGDFKLIVDELTKNASLGDEDAVQASFGKLGKETAENLIARICNLQEKAQIVRHGS